MRLNLGLTRLNLSLFGTGLNTRKDKMKEICIGLVVFFILVILRPNKKANKIEIQGLFGILIWLSFCYGLGYISLSLFKMFTN